jgi:hypothetical protein
VNKIRLLQLSGLSAIFLLHSCIIDLGPTIYGDGDVVTRDRQVEPFNILKVSAGIDVFITQGDHEALVVEADENLHEVILTEVTDNALKVYTEHNIRHAEAKKVHVTYKNLSSIRISSAGDVEGVNRMQADELSISLSSAGDLKLELDARRIDIDVSSSGDASLSGTTDELDADLSSAGELRAFSLEAKKCRVDVSSAGDAWVNASEELDMSSSSAGDIYYMGNATITHMSTSSAGSIIRK